MEDFLRKEGVVQSSKVELQDASNGVHVVVILVPCQRVLTYIRTRRQREEGGGGGGREKIIKHWTNKSLFKTLTFPAI